MKETKILKIMPSEDGIDVIVAEISYGFSVALKDECGEVFAVRVYQTEAEAMKQAGKLVG